MEIEGDEQPNNHDGVTSNRASGTLPGTYAASSTHKYERVQPSAADDLISNNTTSIQSSVVKNEAAKTSHPKNPSAIPSPAPSSSAAPNKKTNSAIESQHNQPQNHIQSQPEVPSRPTAASRWNSIRLSLGIGGGQAPPTENHNRPPENTQEQVIRSLNWFGKKVYDAIETIGEGVVSVLGLDDSHFQDVLDGMTEEEMEVAERINREREEEYMIYKAKKENEQTHAVDVESATTSESNHNEGSTDPSAVVLSI